jgi:hypothetical protein
MITERSYKHALAVIEQYNKEQEESKEVNLKNAGITLDDDIYELYSKGLVSSKLTLSLRQIWKWENSWKDAPEDFILNCFTDLTETDFSKHRGVGKKTVDEFVKLMGATGHTVL